MMEGPAQDYLPGQHLMSRKIKIKGSPLSRDLDQVEVTTEKVEGTTVKGPNMARGGVNSLFKNLQIN